MCFFKAEYCNQALADKIVNNDSEMSFAGVVAGNNVGEVWVNDLLTPSFALVWSEYLGGFSFMGTNLESINALKLRNFIDNTIYLFLKNKGINYFEFSSDLESWMPFIWDSLSNHKIKCEEQFVYRLDKKAIYNNAVRLSDGYKSIEVTYDLLRKGYYDFKNFDILQNEITKAWYSIDLFLQYGKGFIAAYNDEICSFALTHFRYDNTYSIGIETFDPHKQKGLSSNLVKLLINLILEENGNVWWDCMESNVASQKTAQKAGLVYDYKYKVCWFDY